jgi:hypothetical protein
VLAVGPEDLGKFLWWRQSVSGNCRDPMPII